ncbi:MAG: hypothetical protein LBV69_07780 [Bacteroidales bacterium]|jgi:hypothetical protein|nr:hypothetical protein [Bacteroidales bacterium]
MKKCIFILIFSVVVISLFAAAPPKLRVTKIGGRWNKDLDQVTYKYVYWETTNGTMSRLVCKWRGFETCPKISIITVGDGPEYANKTNGLTIAELETMAEKTIKDNLFLGNTSGKIIFKSSNTIIYYQDAQFVKDDEGNLTDEIEYDMTIDFENQFKY